MKKEIILQIILSLAVFAFVFYIFDRQKKKKMYYDYVSNLGFGSFWLDKLSANELETLYFYIHNFTQKGIPIYEGNPLFDKLTKLEKKYPALFPNGLNNK